MKLVLSIIAILGIAVFLNSCTKKSKQQQSEIVTLDPAEIKPGPIQYEDLSEDQLTKIESIQKAFEEVLPITLKETITNFKRDFEIDKEIDLWLKMKATFEKVMNTKQYEAVAKRKEVFKIILMRTMMPQNDVLNSVEVHELSVEDKEYILKEFESQLNM